MHPFLASPAMLPASSLLPPWLILTAGTKLCLELH